MIVEMVNWESEGRNDANGDGESENGAIMRSGNGKRLAYDSLSEIVIINLIYRVIILIMGFTVVLLKCM